MLIFLHKMTSPCNRPFKLCGHAVWNGWTRIRNGCSSMCGRRLFRDEIPFWLVEILIFYKLPAVRNLPWKLRNWDKQYNLKYYMLMRISRRFINPIPGVRIVRTRNTCTWKLRDTTWDVLFALKFRKGKEKKKHRTWLVGNTTFSRLNLSSLQIVDS